MGPLRTYYGHETMTLDEYEENARVDFSDRIHLGFLSVEVVQDTGLGVVLPLQENLGSDRTLGFRVTRVPGHRFPGAGRCKAHVDEQQLGGAFGCQ